MTMWTSRILPLAVVLATAPAASQSFDAAGPRRPLLLPPGLGATASPAPSAETDSRPAEAATILRPLPALAGPAAVKGPAGTLTWPVMLTAAQAAQEVSLTLAPLSSIAVRPDTSTAEIGVNGTAIGRMRLGLPDTPTTIRIPPRLLQAGWNSLTATVRQQHRVDCSPQATAELTTAFDATASGLVVAPSRATTLADLAAASPRADGALVVSVVADRTLAPDLVPRVARAVQSLALLTGTLHPVVEITADAAAPSGIVVALGPQGTLGRVLPEEALRQGPLAVVPAAEGAAPVLVVTGETPEAIDRALVPLTDLARRAAGADAASRLTNAIPLAPNEATRRLEGPRASLSAEIVLPADAFPADYGQATVKVRGTLSPEVLPSARLLVSVNGREAAATTLARGRWGQADQATVALPYGLLRPGRNRIDLAADLPTAADLACDPLRQTEATRFTLAPESAIELSEPARALRLPELAGLSAGGWPTGESGVFTLHVPRPDRGSLAAALTLTARLAVASGRVLAPVFAVDAPLASSGPVLTVGPVGAIGADRLASTGLQRAQLQAGWASPRRAPGDDPCEMPGSGMEAATVVAAGAPGAPRNDAGRPREGWMASLAQRGVDRLGFGRGIKDGGSGLATAADLVIAQADDGALVATARDSATLEQGVACVSRPRTWSRLGGQSSALELASGGVTAVRAAGVTLRPTTWTPGNLRRVLAGWLALNAYAYVSMSLFAAAALGACTAGVVRRSGRSQP